MDTKFPVINVTTAALKVPLDSPLNILKGFGLFLLSAVIGALVLVLFLLVGNINPETLSSMPDMLETGDYSALVGAGFSLFFGMLILVAIVGLALAHIFNYWVRLSAFGEEDAAFETKGDALKAAFINMVKFILIAILIGLVSAVVQFVLSSVGLTDSFSEQMAKATAGDMAGQLRGGLLSTFTSMIVSCLIYSLFSANLTQTAVGNEREGLEHPHTVDFAIVLLLLYSVLMVPVILTGLAGWLFIMAGFQYVLGLYIMFAVPAAHGLRYNLCIHNEQQATSSMDDTES